MPKNPHILIYHGADHYRRTAAVRNAVTRLLDGGSPDFDFTRIDGNRTNPEEIATALRTPPFLAARRVVLLEDAEHLLKDSRDCLKSEIDLLTDATTVALIMVYSGGKKPNRTFKPLAGTVEAFEPFRYPDQAERWLKSHAQESGIQLVGKAASELVKAIGSEDSGQLAQELVKLHAMTGGAVTSNDIEMGTGMRAGESPFDFYDYVGEKRTVDAHRSLGRILLLPDYGGVRLVVGLSIHLAKMGHARAIMDGGNNPGDVDGSFRNYFGKKIVQQAKRWTLEELDRALAHLLSADIDLKSGGNDRRTLELFLAEIGHGLN